MNILYTLPDLHFGGAANLLLQSLPAIAAEHNVHLIYFGPNKSLEQAFVDAGITPVRIKYSGITDIFSTITSVRKFIRKNKIDVVHCNLILDKTLTALATRGMPVKTVGALHSAGKQIGRQLRKHVVKNAFEVFLHKNVFDKSIAVSEASKSFWAKHNRVDAKKIVVITNGIRPLVRDNVVPEQIHDFVQRFPILIGTACRFHYIKGLPRLVRVFGKVRSTLPHVGLILVGDGGHRSAVETEIQKQNLSDAVLITGFSDNVAAYLSHLQYYVNSSFTEAMPISVIEALSLGIPVIGSNVGGMPEIITPGKNGYLVDFADEEKAAQEIITVLREHERNYKGLAVAATQSFRAKFSADIYAVKLGNLYASLDHVEPLK